MKLVNVNQLSQLHSLDPLVRERMVEKIEILNENYGEHRRIEDLGGFVTYMTHMEQLDELLKQFPVTEAEYVDAFIGADEENYGELLLLAGSDYHIVIFVPLELLQYYPNFNINE